MSEATLVNPTPHNPTKLVEVDFEGLARDALEAFQMFEPWSQVEFTSKDKFLEGIVAIIKARSQNFRHALSQTIQTSRNYLELSSGAIKLCSDCRADPGSSSIIDFLIDKSSVGATQAEEVVQKFRSLQQGVSNLTTLIPFVAQRVEFEIFLRDKSKNRFELLARYAKSAKEAIGYIDKVSLVVNPFISAAMPGLGVVLPTTIGISKLIADAVAKSAHSKIQKRGKETLAWRDAIQRLLNISNVIETVVGHIDRFSSWWKAIGSVFLNLKHASAATPSDTSPCWTPSSVLRDFLAGSQIHRCYISNITYLEDFFPDVAEPEGVDSSIMNAILSPHFGVVPDGNTFYLENYLQAITQSRQHYWAMHRSLSNTYLDEKHLQALSRSFRAECSILDNTLESMSLPKHAKPIRSTDIASASEDTVRRKLYTLADACAITRATFDNCKRELGLKYWYFKELRSLKKAMKKQHECIIELLFNTHYFPMSIFEPTTHSFHASPELCDAERRFFYGQHLRVERNNTD